MIDIQDRSEDLKVFARIRVRNRERAKRLKWLNWLLTPICIVVLFLFLRAALRADMYAAMACFGVVGILAIFFWRAR